jgi:hypothetical protein
MAKTIPMSRPETKAKAKAKAKGVKPSNKTDVLKNDAESVVAKQEERLVEFSLLLKPPAEKQNAMTYAVSRLLRLKFAHVSRTKLATVVDSEGNSLEDIIGAEIRRTNISGEYIKAKFWAVIEHDFGLQCADWEALAEPADEIAELEPYDTELPSIIVSVLGDNPAMKSKGLDRLEVHLDSCDRLPLRQVYGLLLESCESSKVSRAQSQRFQWMLLRFVAKHGVFDYFPNLSNINHTFSR